MKFLVENELVSSYESDIMFIELVCFDGFVIEFSEYTYFSLFGLRENRESDE